MNKALQLFAITSVFVFFASVSDANGAISSDRGDEPGYWNAHSAIVAEVTSVVDNGPIVHSRLGFRPIGTLSGLLDAGRRETVEAQASLGLNDTSIRHAPKRGDLVVVILWERPEDNGGFTIDNDYADYMPPPRANLFQVRGEPGLAVDKILASIRDVRKKSTDLPKKDPGIPVDGGFWPTHGLVYGKIGGKKPNGDDPGSATIGFQPILRLSGDLDPGLIDKLDAHIDLKALRVPPSAIPANGNAIVLLVRDGDSYAVASERADFMPGDHSPICVVKDFSDPKVLDTLKAVQELRKKEKPAEKNDK